MFKLAYKLHEHGWATASISDGESTVEMAVSYLTDALRDLARAAREVLGGLPEATFLFCQEPGGHRFFVSREGDLVRVRAFRFDEIGSRSASGELVMVADCSLREFARECISCLRRVLDEHGQDGYRERWKNADFPTREYHALLELRRKLWGGRPAK